MSGTSILSTFAWLMRFCEDSKHVRESDPLGRCSCRMSSQRNNHPSLVYGPTPVRKSFFLSVVVPKENEEKGAIKASMPRISSGYPSNCTTPLYMPQLLLVTVFNEKLSLLALMYPSRPELFPPLTKKPLNGAGGAKS